MKNKEIDLRDELVIRGWEVVGQVKATDKLKPLSDKSILECREMRFISAGPGFWDVWFSPPREGNPS
jgi:hypothetical protein